LPSPNPGAADQVSIARNWRLISVFWLAFLWAVIYVAAMFTPGLLDDADSLHAEAAREMLTRHDWVTLYVNGIRYLEKAPLMYWGVASSYTLFGVSDWSTRLPLVLGILALLLAVYALGRYAYGEQGGFLSAVVMATTIGPYLFTRFLIPDTLVGLWLALGFYFFLRSLDEDPPRRITCWGLAVCCALNVLTKGLIGIVFPVAVIGLFLLFTGNLRHLLRMRLLSSSLIFLVVAAPWHVLAALRNPSEGEVHGFLWFYFVNEHFLRYVGKRVPHDYDRVPLLLFWALLLIWLLPWVAFLPQAIKDVPLRWRSWRTSLMGRQRGDLLFFLWALVILVFFSFSTRQEYYTIPAVPGLALLVGGWLARETESPPASTLRRAGRQSSLLLFVVGGAVCILGSFLLFASKPPAPGTDLSDLLTKNPEDYKLSFGHFMDLTPQAMGAFRAPLLGFSVAFLLGTGLNWWLRRRGNATRGNWALAAMMIVLLTCVHSAYVTFSPILSSKALAMAIKQHYQPGDVIVVDGEYSSASTLNFYTGVRLQMLHEPNANLWYGSKFSDAPHIWETQSSFDVLWAGPTHVFMWTDQENPKELHGSPRYVLARSGGKFVLTNFPPLN